MIVRVHKIRLNPSARQAKYFARACGVARFAYNWALAEWMCQHKERGKPNEASLRKQLNAIKAAGFPWMAEVTKCAAQVAIKNVGLAFEHFFRRVLGATVSRMADGWYVALCLETEARLKAVGGRGAVGVDLGIRTLATFSDGHCASALKPHRAAHKRMVRKQKGSANRGKAKARLARLHLRIANVRKDGLHKLTTTLATNYSTIGIEDLNVSGKLARAIADAGFFEFRRQLEYKAAMTGAQVIVIDRFYPGSKTCSGCGAIHAFTLAERVIECDCGLKMDRDVNAAINIRRQALAQQSVERKALAVASATVKPASAKQKKSGLHSHVQTTWSGSACSY